jgi:hypothetical protein
LKTNELSEVAESPSISRRELAAQLDKLTGQSVARQTARERAIYHEKSALAVIEAYGRIRQLSPVVSSSPDPDPIKRSEKLTYTLIDYCADVESATERALANQPELQRVWFDIALDKPAAANLRNKVLQACGRMYTARGLAPWQYWRPSRYVRRASAVGGTNDHN